jgi:acetyltransferase-like isoleucine patch superfamily enzyme
VIHPTADVEEGARVGANTRVWHHAHIRNGAAVGDNCTLGHSVYVDIGARVGNNCKLENRVSVFRGVTLEDGVFVGPHSSFTNDRYPRAVRDDGGLVEPDDWTPEETLVKYGASIGAGCVILSGLTIGRWAMVAAGSIVTRDVPDHGLVVGNPAQLAGYVCTCAHPLEERDGFWCCTHCDSTFELPPLPLEEAS